MSRTLLLLSFFAFLAYTFAHEASVDATNAEVPINKDHKLSTFSAFAQSFSSIMVSEIGDNTFLIAAIMSMRYSRVAVLSGALLALVAMTIISTAFGSVVPTILSPYLTHIVVTILFFFFGGKLLYDAIRDKDDDDSDEEAEVEEELDQVHAKLVKQDPKGVSEAKKKDKGKYDGISKKLVFWQALSLIFLGEWGDRSQITTIALAAEGHPVAVSIGSFSAHALCTVFAVIGGKLLAKKISEKTMNIIGGVLFLIFGVYNLVDNDD